MLQQIYICQQTPEYIFGSASIKPMKIFSNFSKKNSLTEYLDCITIYNNINMLLPTMLNIKL